MQQLEKIYFVVSVRTRDGEVNYELADNLTKAPRGSRKVFGTGHYNLDLVMQRLNKCENGLWFKEQNQERRKREKEDERLRQRIHRDYLASKKRQSQRV